jgi:hypothetical protein
LRQSKIQAIQQELESDTSSDSDTIEHSENECDISNVGNEIYWAEKIYSPKMENPESAETTSYTLHNDSGTQTQSWPSLCVEKFEDDPAGMMFYTGLQSYYDFKFVLASLGEVVYNLNYMYYRSEQLSVENQFFLTLIKLRQHKTNFELSRLFNISEPAVSNNWITWINFMTCQWKEINIWPEQDVVRCFSPQDFKRQFPTTRVIIDGTECPVKKPKSPIAQQSTFSTYINRNTIKLRVGATPGGLVSLMVMEKVFHEKVLKTKYYQNICSIWNKYTLTEVLNIDLNKALYTTHIIWPQNVPVICLISKFSCGLEAPELPAVWTR